MIIAWGLLFIGVLFLSACTYSYFNYERMIENGALEKDTKKDNLVWAMFIFFFLFLGSAQYIWG